MCVIQQETEEEKKGPPLSIIFKGQGTVMKKEAHLHHPDVKAFWQKNAWCDVNLFMQWIVELWWPYVKENFSNDAGEITPTLLYLDNLTSHTPECWVQLLLLCGTRAVFLLVSICRFIKDSSFSFSFTHTSIRSFLHSFLHSFFIRSSSPLFSAYMTYLCRRVNAG
jgi:hypothetical protein